MSTVTGPGSNQGNYQNYNNSPSGTQPKTVSFTITDKDGNETVFDGKDKYISGSDWKSFTTSEKQSLVNKWKNDPDFAKLFNSSGLDAVRADGYILTTETVDGKNVTKIGQNTAEDDKDLAAKLKEVGLTFDKEKGINGKKEFGKGDYDKLNSAQQNALYEIWAFGYIDDSFFSDGLKEKFQEIAKKQFGNDGSNLTRRLVGDIQSANDSFDIEIANKFKPSLDLPKLSLFSGELKGKIRDADSWTFGIMLISTNMQRTMSTALTDIINTSSNKDQFLFNKSLAVNEKRFEGLKLMNKQTTLAQKANMRKKRNFFQRIGDMFKKLFKGDIGGFFKDLGSIINSFMPWTIIANRIKSLILTVKWIVLRIQLAGATGDAEKVAKLNGQLKALEKTMEEHVLTMGGGSVTYGEGVELADKKEIEEMEKALNELTAEDSEYLTYADIGNFIEWSNERARDVKEAFDIAVGVITGVVAAVGFWMGGLIPVMLAISALAGAAQYDAVMEANVFTVEVQSRIAQLKERAAHFDSLSTELDALREKNRDDINLYGKIGEEMMKFLEYLQESINDVLNKMAEMEQAPADDLMQSRA